MQTHQLVVRWPEADDAGHEQEEYRTQRIRLQATMTQLMALLTRLTAGREVPARLALAGAGYICQP